MKREKGFSLIATIFVMVMFLLLGMTLVSILSGDVISSVGRMNYLNAFYVAQGGIYTGANLLLLNDYDWIDNNYPPGGTIRNLPAGKGYPPSNYPPFTYTGSSDSNAVQRDFTDPQFEFAHVDTYITWVQTDEAMMPNQNIEENWPGEWLGWSCVIDSNGHVRDSSARITQKVRRYLCPTLKYGISASRGRIEFNAGAINFQNVLSGQNVVLISQGINWGTGTISGGKIHKQLSLPYPLQPIAEYQPILAEYERSGPLDLDPGGGDTGPVFVIGDIRIISGGTINGLVCATGSISILSTATPLTINGGLIAGRDLTIDAGVQLTVNSDNYIPDGNFPAMVAGLGSINGSGLQTLDIKGLVFAGGNVDLQSTSNMNFEGSIAANGAIGVKLHTPDNLTIKYNPKVRLTYGFRDTHPCGMVNNRLYYGEWKEELVFHEKPKP